MRFRVLGTAVVMTATAVGAQASTAPAFVSPTTTTTPPLVLVAPTSTTTATTTTTTTTTTAPQVIATPTTAATTAPPLIVTPTTPAITAPPLVVTPTTATTAPPVIAAETTTTLPADPADTPIGAIDPSGAVPDGLDLTAFPDAPAAPGPVGDGPQIAAGFSCAYQCIKSGVAYPRGIGALLVVETHVPARLFMSVIDGNNDLVDHANSAGMVTEMSWALDHLDTGETYFVMVAATDEHDDTAYAYGEFTTLSTRTVEISVGAPAFTGGPTNVLYTNIYLKVSTLDFVYVVPTQILSYGGWHRHVDLTVRIFREWDTSQFTDCDLYDPDAHGAQGDSDRECGSWNSASIDEFDVDAIPAGRSRWTEVTFTTTFQTGSDTGALPPSYDPRYFDFSVPVTLSVTYS